MNPSKVHAALQEQSKQYVAELDGYKSDFENAVSDFLTSSQKNFLLIETTNSKLAAIRIRQILKRLVESKENEKALGRYLSAEKQTFLHWNQLLDMVGTAKELPSFTNLLVCVFPDRESEKIDNIQEDVLHKIRDRLKIAVLKKIVFITSQKGVLDECLQEDDSDACLKIDEFGNKVASVVNHGTKALLDMASRGDANGVQKLLQKGADVNATGGQDKMTALHAAAENGHKDVVLTLLRNGADIYLPNSNEDTPLHIAAQYGQTDVISVLLENIDVDCKSFLGRTALYDAICNSYVDVVKTLLEHGADINADNNKSRLTPLQQATLHNRIEIVNILLNYGADINADCNNVVDRPFHLAAKGGRFDIVKIFVERGANIHDKNPSGKTPLDLALEGGYDKIVSLLRSI